MDLELDVYAKMVLSLLKASLNNISLETSFFLNASEEDWKRCMAFSRKQGVLALVWDGIMMLPQELMPPRSIKLSWALAVEKYEQNYNKYLNTVSELFKLLAQHGIAATQLKGIGLSAYYPHPMHREGGDIDIYTYSLDTEKFCDSEANLMTDNLMREKGIKVDDTDRKHSSFFYNGIPVENHRFFLETESIHSAVSLDNYLRKVLNPKPTLVGGVSINTPSVQFNTLFLAFHALQHYGRGLCLHHLCDWAVFIKKEGLVVPEELKDEKIVSVMYALTAFTNQYLGTNIDVFHSEALLKKITKEIFKYQYTLVAPKDKNILSTGFHELKRFYHFLSFRKEVLGEPIIHGICHSVNCRIKRLLTKKNN